MHTCLASALETFLTTVFVVICALLIIVVLLQRGRGGGMGGILGGAGHTAFGTRTGDVFTWVTIVLVAMFLLLAVITTWVHRPPRKSVSAPDFVPDPQPISEPILVTIRCNTGGADIYFTVDGAEPTKASLAYEAPVRVEPGMTVKAKAFLRGWNESETAVAAYTDATKLVVPAPKTRPAATATAPATAPATATAPASGPASAPAP